MPFKHTVTDSRGNIHTRTSENRAYPFAIVIRFTNRKDFQGNPIGDASRCNWASSEKLAHASARQYAKSWGYAGYEVIPCTPVPTGRHLLGGAL